MNFISENEEMARNKIVGSKQANSVILAIVNIHIWLRNWKENNTTGACVVKQGVKTNYQNENSGQSAEHSRRQTNGRYRIMLRQTWATKRFRIADWTRLDAPNL